MSQPPRVAPSLDPVRFGGGRGPVERPDALAELFATIEARRGADPAQSYVASLLARGSDAFLKKLGEEAAETLLAAKAVDLALAVDDDPTAARQALVHELADLWFHSLVTLAAYDLPLSALTDELARRAGRSGLDEKASRGTR